jgi:hypothetical protein
LQAEVKTRIVRDKMEGINYKISGYSVYATIILAIIISIAFKWSYTAYPVNFMGGDAEDYYSSLISTFINKDLTQQSRDVWFLLKTDHGTINQHPIGVAVLLLPFFLVALFIAPVLNFPVDGLSLPFQVAVAVAGLFYAVTGLYFLRKLCRLNNINDKITAIIIPLIFFGTNLLNYTLSEAGMSHVYSFGLISAFLYLTCRYVNFRENKILYISAAVLGLILLVRPNNIFAVLFIFIWFRNFNECGQFFKDLFSNRNFYFAALLTFGIFFLQNIVWYLQTGLFFHHTYKADGFYWLNPQIFKMLFGFNAGFFIYTPLCLLLMGGLVVLYKKNRFSFLAVSGIFLLLFYFFASYCSYTFFDGLGIRVLVDYYALFGFLGAKLFNEVSGKYSFGFIFSAALLLAFLNLIYCYQANRGIILRAGMNYNKWKYVFLKTGKEYQDCLGGSNELTPYSPNHPEAALKDQFNINNTPFNYADKDFGVVLAFDSIGFDSNRVKVRVDCSRRELYANSSKDAYICMSLEDRKSKENKFYAQFRLNETPSKDCCDVVEYNYTANLAADFNHNDRLSVYVWNTNRQPFYIDKFSVEIYNYNYKIN